jgi:UDPglucose 6-dehydrogenase
MKITVIGTGYVGLVSGACFADSGNTVLCLDLDARKIDVLNSGGIPIHEPGLESVVQRNVAAGRLIFSTSYDEAISHGDVIFIAVGTPPDEDGSADLSHVLAAARSIGQRISRPVVVVNKSTVPVGTADAVRLVIEDELRKREAIIEFHVVSNPEFLKEGAAIADFMRPDRIVVGSNNASASSVMRQLYKPFNRNHEKMIEMDVRSAELTKYAANAMLATRISFMNELANVAEMLGADIEAVRYGIGSDPRIGPDFLYAGVGYGGSCFPKDVKALVKIANGQGKTLRVLEAVESANELQKNVMFAKICKHFGGPAQLKGMTLALWGLAFKPNTDDMREAPSLVLIRQLMAAGCYIKAYDPVAKHEAQRILLSEHGEQQCNELLQFADSPWGAVQGADALALITEWREFRSPDLARLQSVLARKVIFDGRNLYDRKDVEAAGLVYYGIGR